MPRHVAAAARRAAKQAPEARRRPQLCSYLDKYSKAIIVHADNVGSNQLMLIRKARPASLRHAPCTLRRAAAGVDLRKSEP